MRVTPIEGSDPSQCVWDVQPYGHRFISGLHHTVVTLATLEHHLVVDHALDHRGWVEECLALWRDLPVYLIGVRCPVPVLLERAEARTAERMELYPQIVRWEVNQTHRWTHDIYDLAVDTSRLRPQECAQAILDHVLNVPPRAFDELRWCVTR